MCWYQASNGYSSPALYQGKPVFYKNNQNYCLRSTNLVRLTEKYVNTLMRLEWNNEGWMDVGDFWLVNQLGRNSVRFKRICQIY